MNDLLNSSGFVALISTVGALGVAYIANVLSKKRRDQKHPDRMSTIFDGYEKLISQQQEEIIRKGATITTLEVAMSRLEQQLDDTRQLLNNARDELNESKIHSEDLRDQLNDMRKVYKNAANDSKA